MTQTFDEMLQKIATNVSTGMQKLARAMSDSSQDLERTKHILKELLMNCKFAVRASKSDPGLLPLVEVIDVWVELHDKVAYATKAEVFAQAKNVVKALREATLKVLPNSSALSVYDSIVY